jgi:hypothetical protein
MRLPRRFKGMQATLASNNTQHFSLAELGGLQTSSMLSSGSSGVPSGSSTPGAQAGQGLRLPIPAAVAEQVLQELGEEWGAAKLLACLGWRAAGSLQPRACLQPSRSRGLEARK